MLSKKPSDASYGRAAHCRQEGEGFDELTLRSQRFEKSMIPVPHFNAVGSDSFADYSADLDADEWHFKVLGLIIKISLVLPVVCAVRAEQSGRRARWIFGKVAVRCAVDVDNHGAARLLSAQHKLTFLIKDTEHQMDMMARHTAPIAVLSCIALKVDRGETAF